MITALENGALETLPAISESRHGTPKTNPADPDQVVAKLRVLVAEDHPVNREVIHTMLSQHGITADFAENGRIAIDCLEANRYDLLLLDIQMPILNGFGVASWVRSHWPHRWPPPRLVAVTANATHGSCRRHGRLYR
ncbi:MAG: response regulator [Candidatus Synoicihabitans palmerolidicus]|nr:response regulator [Candidatus Synoicihabitans palmerolidicus]